MTSSCTFEIVSRGHPGFNGFALFAAYLHNESTRLKARSGLDSIDVHCKDDPTHVEEPHPSCDIVEERTELATLSTADSKNTCTTNIVWEQHLCISYIQQTDNEPAEVAACTRKSGNDSYDASEVVDSSVKPMCGMPASLLKRPSIPNSRVS